MQHKNRAETCGWQVSQKKRNVFPGCLFFSSFICSGDGHLVSELDAAVVCRELLHEDAVPTDGRIDGHPEALEVGEEAALGGVGEEEADVVAEGTAEDKGHLGAAGLDEDRLQRGREGDRGRGDMTPWHAGHVCGCAVAPS